MEYRRYSQTSASASCPPLLRDGGIQDEVHAGKGAGGGASQQAKTKQCFWGRWGMVQQLVPAVFPLRKSSPSSPENPDAKPDLRVTEAP